MISTSVAAPEEGDIVIAPILLIFFHAGLDGSSEVTVADIESTLEKVRVHVDRWRTTIEALFPNVTHNAFPSSELSLHKAKNVMPTTGTCNHA